MQQRQWPPVKLPAKVGQLQVDSKARYNQSRHNQNEKHNDHHIQNDHIHFYLKIPSRIFTIDVSNCHVK